MRNITVDFSQRPPLISDKYAGEIGEHQATTLNIIPETNMSTDTDIAFYYVLFKVEGGLVASRTFSQGESISIALWGQLLEDRRLTFQLIGTNGLESIISKSPILTLYLGDSLEGTVIGIDDNRDSLIAMIGAFNERLDDDEEKLNTIETGAEANVIDEIDSFDGTALPVVNKVVTLPNTSPLETRKNSSELLYTPAEINTEYQKGRRLLFGGLEIISFFYRPNTSSTFTALNQQGKCVTYSVDAGDIEYSEVQSFYIPTEQGAEPNAINEIDTADGTALSINRKVVTLPDFVLPSDLNDYIAKPSSVSDGNVLVYNATESKWDAESRVKNFSGMTGNEIRDAWNRGDELKCVASGSLFESKIIKVRNYTSTDVPGVIVSYWWSDTTPSPESVNREYIRNTFIRNESTATTNLTALTRYGVTEDERVKLSGGAIESGNSSFVTGGQVYSEGYLKSIPTASTSTLGGVKVDGTSITINDGVISAHGGGGGASAFVVTFSMQGGGLVADKTIAEIYEAYDNGNIVIGTMTQNGISYVFSLDYIGYAEGDSGAAYFSSLNNNGSPAIIQCIGTYNGSTDSWSPIMTSIPSAGQIQSGDTGYATGGDVYTAIGNVESILAELIGGA